MYDRTTLQGATFNMHGQLYRRHANAMTLLSSPVVCALGSESDDPSSSPNRGKALCPWEISLIILNFYFIFFLRLRTFLHLNDAFQNVFFAAFTSRASQNIQTKIDISGVQV